MAKNKNLSTFTIAEMLHVDPGSVANWIDQKLLKAYRTPGGHRRVFAGDLLAFLRERDMPIPPQLKPRALRVLVVDDPSSARLISRALQQTLPEVEAVEANDGFRAGVLAATLGPEVVILDLDMPGMDGPEVCKFIKDQQETRHANILVIMSSSSQGSEKDLLRCGTKACLTKPLNMDALVAEVRNLL